MTNTRDSLQTLRRLIAYGLADRPLLRSALVFLLIATVADVCGPYLIKIFIDDHVRPASYETGSLLVLLVSYIFLQLTTAGANYLHAMRFNKIAVNAVQTIRETLFASVIHRPLAFFDRTPTGSLISRLTNDTETIKDLYVNVLSTYIQNTGRILAVFIAMGFLDWRLMLVCSIYLPAVVALMFFYHRYSTPRFHRVRSLISDINTRLHESIQGVRIIQLFNQQVRFTAQFTDVTEDHVRAKLSNLKLDALLLRPFIDFLHLLTLGALLWLFGLQALESVVAVGVIYAFITYLSRFTEPIMEMTQRLNLLQQALVSGHRIFALLDGTTAPRIEFAGDKISRGAVNFDHVRFTYDGEHTVLHDLSFALPPGAFYGIVGHTGSGKSTLGSLLLRFYEPVHGTIAIDNCPLEEISDQELRAKMGIVQQDSFVFSGTISANIAFGRSLAQRDIERAAEQTGLHEFVSQLPLGYATELTERGSNLSSGQKQLLALTRTLAGKPKILILDEATANIDSHSEALIQTSLAALQGHITLIVIAHRLSTIRHADKILVMQHGGIVESGTHDDLYRQNGLYRDLYRLQELSPTQNAQRTL